MSEKDLKIKLLEMQIEALRSVISEFHQDSDDLSCYSQWLKAESIAELLNHVRGYGD